MRCHFKKVIAVSILSVSLISLNADSETEREALTRLVQELQLLIPIVDRAERHANSQRRVRFRYDWLRKDLERMSTGIRDHLEDSRLEPRVVEPLRGEYQR